MKIKIILAFMSSQMFLIISILISFYFGFHGYRFLKNSWLWDWEIALSTIILVEAVFLNVFRAKSYSKSNRIPVFIFGIIAMVFSVSLPLLSFWTGYQKLDRIVTANINLSEPQYYEEKVIPALERELKEAEDLIAPRVAEKRRRLKIGAGIFEKRPSKNGKVRIVTGLEAASWIPYTKGEISNFRKVEELKNTIRKYREKDKLATDEFAKLQNESSAKLEGAKSDRSHGGWMFVFQFGLIIFLGFSSLYYMYSYNNPDEKENLPTSKVEIPEETNFPLTFSNPEFVKTKYPDAVGKKVGDLIQIQHMGIILGSAKNAPHAWRNARENIQNKQL